MCNFNAICVTLLQDPFPVESSTGSDLRIGLFRVTGLIVMLQSYFKERYFLFLSWLPNYC